MAAEKFPHKGQEPAVTATAALVASGRAELQIVGSTAICWTALRGLVGPHVLTADNHRQHRYKIL